MATLDKAYAAMAPSVIVTCEGSPFAHVILQKDDGILASTPSGLNASPSRNAIFLIVPMKKCSQTSIRAVFAVVKQIGLVSVWTIRQEGELLDVRDAVVMLLV